MPNITIFDPTKRYIFVSIFALDKGGELNEFDVILDTGAPMTEFSDEALQHLGLMERSDHNIHIREGLQTQKYGKIVLPYLEICGHPLENLEVYVSRFDKSWGIKALIGLDFFRKFRTTIDYQEGQIITESFCDKNLDNVELR